MNEKRIASLTLLISVGIILSSFFIAVHIDDWLFSISYINENYSRLILVMLFIPLTYVICGLMLLFVNNEISKKWLINSLWWTIPSTILLFFYGFSEVTAGPGFHDFGIYIIFYFLIWAINGTLVIFTPYYLYHANKNIPIKKKTVVLFLCFGYLLLLAIAWIIAAIL